jgi:hypothetical protein
MYLAHVPDAFVAHSDGQTKGIVSVARNTLIRRWSLVSKWRIIIEERP